MKKTVVLSIEGRQCYPEQEPEIIRLTTEGTMEFRDGGWDITYEESALTGLEGVTTTFRIESGAVILSRTGKLDSTMIFREGVPHDSLYRLEFGALHLRVCAQRILVTLGEQGGMVDLVYTVEIENTEAGQIDYHLDIRTKE